ncbi:MAG TPA: HNH endonuclease signature motif containing protein [Ferruginibacter sp.]|nr:HNH endonuclease signature motif containing protein [Ferruginibacter sp.]
MIEKKIRIRVPKESKVRAELQMEIDSCCPFCKSSDVGHFEIHHIDDNPANNYKINLILVCPTCHSKITKGDINPIDVMEKKIALMTNTPKTASNATKIINFNSRIKNAVIGDNNNVSIKEIRKTIKQKYPEGSIGFDTVKANYIGHLINRYNEYKEYEVGKEAMNYGRFGASLKSIFRIAPTRTIYNVPINRFEELVSIIQSHISKTKLARVKGKNHKNYSTYEEYKNQAG